MRPLAGLLVCLRFFSRLPVPASVGDEPHDLASAVLWVPAAGLVIGLIPALVLVASLGVGLPPLLAAALAVAALVAATGALHEDGLADCADGFGGGRSVARKLEIMRDSRIGTFGTCAVALSLMARIAAVGAVAGGSPLSGAAAIVAAAILSRTACLLPLVTLAPARADGLGASADRPRMPCFLAAVGIAIVLSASAALPRFGLARAALAPALAFLGAQAVSRLARRQIGGVTGDVAGAAQQAAELAVLTILATLPAP